ncbi:MAG TPA: hypothetical protein VHD81_09790 [Mycobacteriales bacterium]|nr:hypothetical protein [Mycobacteriales bacterium]
MLPVVTLVVVGGAVLVGHSFSGHGRVASTRPGFTSTSAPPPDVAPVSGLPKLPCPKPSIVVRSAVALRTELSVARPGTVIRLADGVYPGNFVGQSSGSRRQPIWVCGGRNAIIDGGRAGRADGYGFHLDGASWWKLAGFSVRNVSKGVVVDHGNHDVLYRLTVYNIGDEAVHLRRFSSHDAVEGCVIRDSGLQNATFGEGVYLGTARSNWSTDTGGVPDASDDDSVRWCDIARTTAEAVDVKEGTSRGVVSDNRFDGTGMVASAATSWVNVKGSSYVIEGNIGRDSPSDGLSAHQILAGTGIQNLFAGNRLLGGVPGYGVFVDAPRTVVRCTSGGAGDKGLSNQACSPGG